MMFEIFVSLVFLIDYLAGLISGFEFTIAMNLLLLFAIANVRLKELAK